MGSFRSTRTCDESPPLQTQTQLPRPRNLPNLSQSQGGARSGSQAYDAKHMEGGGGRCGEVADWSRPGSSWRRIDKKLGGRTEEPRGVATCQNYPQRVATLPLGRVAKVWSTYLAKVAKVQKHISDAHYGYRAIYAPKSISRQNRELCKVLHIDRLEGWEDIGEKCFCWRNKTKNHAKHILYFTNLRQPNHLIMLCVCTLLSQLCVASQAQYIVHKMAQFESFVKVFVPGGREGG